MDYTQNYHLPQWDKNDRVLMEDFNGAMANIENGFDRLEEAGEQHVFQRLCRLAYNHYALLRTLSPMPWQNGIFHQTAASGEGVSGFVEFDGCRRLNYADAVDQNTLFRIMRQSSQLKTSPSSSLAVRFTAPCNGTLDRLGISISSYSSSAISFYCRIVCTDRSTGQTVISKSTSFPVPAGTMTYPYGLYVDLCFHQGHEYEITVSTEKSNGATLTASLDAEIFRASCAVTGSTGSISYTFAAPDENMGVLAVARFYSPVNPPKLLWNGGEVPARWIREREEDGERFQEAVFMRRGAAADGDVIQLAFTCPRNQELCFYEWGAALV